MTDDDSLAPRIVAANVVMMVFSSLAVGGRVTLRAVTMRDFGADDAMAVLGWLNLMALLILVIIMTTVGFGSHFDTLTPDMLEKYIWYGRPTFFFYIWGSVFAKLGYAFYFLRLFHDRTHMLLNKAIIVFLFLQGVAETFSSALICVPFSKILIPTIPGACGNISAYYQSFFVMKLISDLSLFVQPVPVLWALELPPVKKVIMFFLVSVGMFVSIFSVVRIRLVPTLYTGDDPTYTITSAMFWSEIEIFSLIVYECVPSLRTLGKRMGPIVRAMVFATQTSRRASSNHDSQGPEASGNSSSRQRRRGGKWRIKRGSRNNANAAAGRSGSGSSRGSRFGVTSLVSATRRSTSNIDVLDPSSPMRTATRDDDEPPEPDHGGILVTRDIEIGIEVDEGGSADDEDESDRIDEGAESEDDDVYSESRQGNSRRTSSPSLSQGAKPVEPLEPV